MVPTVMPMPAAARPAGEALGWDVQALRGYAQALTLLQDVAARLPYHVPRTGLLVLDWHADIGTDDCVRVRPRLDLHSDTWLEVPVAAIRPTGAFVQVDDSAAEPALVVQLPARKGRPGARVPLATGLMRLSMQAHDEHVRFLPVVLQSDLAEDRYGRVSLHLHSLDMAALLARRVLPEEQRRALAATIAERVLALMSLPGAGLARETPMLLEDAHA